MKDFKPVAAALAVAAAVALPAGIAAAADSHAGHHANAGHSGDHKAKGFVCRGALASGTYKKLTVRTRSGYYPGQEQSGAGGGN